MKVLIILLIIAAIALMVRAALGHDIYGDWHMPDNPGFSCCHGTGSGGDCKPARAYLGEDGMWRAWDGRQWLTVPLGKVLPTDFAGDGRSHLCSKNGVVYCFSPTTPKG